MPTCEAIEPYEYPALSRRIALGVFTSRKGAEAAFYATRLYSWGELEHRCHNGFHVIDEFILDEEE